MYKIILVGIGGFIGAVLRYMVSGYIQKLTQSAIFPFGTLAVNVTGCFLIGIFSYLVEFQTIITAEVRLLLMVGLLGSFTTYSTFSNETMNLLIDQKIFLTMLNMVTHITLGMLAVLIGRYTIIAIWG